MKPRRFPLVLFLPTLVVGVLTACGSDPLGPQSPEELTFHPALGVDLAQMTRTDTGLYYQVLEEGTGTEVVELGDSVTFEFKGWFHNGVVFADSAPPENPWNYIVGNTGPTVTQVIAGIDQGVQGMRLNETRLFVIPWELAYGPAGSADGDIPRYANVVFEITIIAMLKP